MGTVSLRQYPEGKIYAKVTPGINSKSKLPLLLFIHAAIADGTMWDEQVKFFSARGFTCVQYDMLGYGRSEADKQYFGSNPDAKVDHVEHALHLILSERASEASQVVVIGLSMGAGIALRLALMYPSLVSGAVVAAGSVQGFDGAEEDPKELELELDAEIEAAINNGDDTTAAKLQVHFWGDGPLQASGRIADDLRQSLYEWCFENVKRQIGKTGGFGLPSVKRPPIPKEALELLQMPLAVAIGNYDETFINAMMEFLAASVKGSCLGRFDTAHMINLEKPDEFNEWLYTWLQTNFNH